MIRFLSIVILILLSLQAKAQSKFGENLQLSADVHHGYVFSEYEFFNYLVEKPIQAIELTISKESNGKNEWQQLYKYPSTGVSLFYTTLGNNKVFGKEIALYPYFRTHIISRDKFSVDNKIGIGLSYVSRFFNIEDNYQNVAIGSSLNIHFNMAFLAAFALHKNLNFQTGIGFHHLSNGNLSEPNLGINSVSVFGGIKMPIGKQTEKIQNDKMKHQKGWSTNTVFALGGKRARALASQYFSTSSLSAELKWHCFKAFHLGTGLDAFYDSSTEIEMAAVNDTPYKGIYDFRTGIHFSQEVIYNRFSLILQEGFYLLLTDQVNQKLMYNRGIVRYKINSRLFVNVSMKSHLHILDYPEFGIGYRW